MEIRKGTLKDLEAIAAVEAACFPAAEAATAEEFAGRLQQYGNHFWLLWEGKGCWPLWTAFAPTGRT